MLTKRRFLPRSTHSGASADSDTDSSLDDAPHTLSDIKPEQEPELEQEPEPEEEVDGMLKLTKGYGSADLWVHFGFFYFVFCDIDNHLKGFMH